MGVEIPPSSSFFQSTLPSAPSALGSQLSMMPVSREIPFCSGPRQFGQSSGSGSAALAAGASSASPQKKEDRMRPTTGHEFRRIMLFSLVRAGVRASEKQRRL